MNGTTQATRTKAATSDFDEYARASGPRLKRLAYLLTGDHADAEDLLQTALAKTMLKWAAVSAYDNPDAYVRRVMVNQRTSWWRRSQGREMATDQVPDRPAHAGGPDAVADSLALRQALRALPERQRAAVVLRHWCDLSEAETAATMGCSVGTVKSSTSKGLAHLRAALSDDIFRTTGDQR